MISQLLKSLKGDRDARYSLLSGIAKRWGFRLEHPHLLWREDENVATLIKGFPGQGGLTAKRYNLYHLAKSIAHLTGDTAECGVATGITSYLISMATGKPHYGFDSYEGLPDHESIDIPSNGIRPLSKGQYAVSLDVVMSNLSNCNNITLYKGWIPSRFKDLPDVQFSFVHIDVDFYEPTLDSIAWFYPRIVSGGILVCDDYGFKGTPGASIAMNKFFDSKPEEIIKLASGQAVVIKR